jgi:hypothetical protein
LQRAKLRKGVCSATSLASHRLSESPGNRLRNSPIAAALAPTEAKNTSIAGQAGGRFIGHDRPSPVVDVGEYRPRPRQRDGVGRFAERVRRCDNLIAWTDRQGLQREQKPNLAARDGDSMPSADILRKFSLERFDDGTGGNPRRR